MTVFHRLLSIGLLAGLLSIPGCQAPRKLTAPPVPVTVAQASMKPARVSLSSVGTVEPIESVAVRPQVGGVIVRVAFTEGEEVSAGQLLFQIDPRPFQAALDAAQAQLARDRAQAANAAIQAKRYADLAGKDYVTHEQYDAMRTQAEMLAATVKVDEAAVRQAKLDLDFASVTAPIGGRSGALLAKRGNVVKAGDLPLVVINQLRPIRVSFAVPGDQLPRIQRYAAQTPLAVRMKANQDGSADLWGRLTFLDNAVDPGTGTVTLKAEFANEQGTLWPGEFVNVELVLTIERNALTVPSGAVVTGQDGTYVYVVGGDRRAQKRPVTVNRTLDGTAVIERGLHSGETVVTDGQMRLVPGAEVTFKTAPGSSR